MAGRQGGAGVSDATYRYCIHILCGRDRRRAGSEGRRLVERLCRGELIITVHTAPMTDNLLSVDDRITYRPL